MYGKMLGAEQEGLSLQQPIYLFVHFWEKETKQQNLDFFFFWLFFKNSKDLAVVVPHSCKALIG